jgi:hypothetical protein
MDVQVLIIILEVPKIFMFIFFLVQIVRHQLGVSSLYCYEMKATIYKD